MSQPKIILSCAVKISSLQFSLNNVSQSNEPDQFSWQRFAEATGGGAFYRRDDWLRQPGVYPDPGGADWATGTTEEKDSAGMSPAYIFNCVSTVKCWLVNLLQRAVCQQVIHNWTIPLHSERNDQMMLTKTFEMLSRYWQQDTVLPLNYWLIDWLILGRVKPFRALRRCAFTHLSFLFKLTSLSSAITFTFPMQWIYLISWSSHLANLCCIVSYGVSL